MMADFIVCISEHGQLVLLCSRSSLLKVVLNIMAGILPILGMIA